MGEHLSSFNDALTGVAGTCPAVLLIGRANAATDAFLQGANCSVIVCTMAALDPALLDRVMPDLVVFPLFADGFDATQIIQRLDAARYRGRALVTAPKLPDCAMVLRELRALAPGLPISLIDTDLRAAILAPPTPRP